MLLYSIGLPSRINCNSLFNIYSRTISRYLVNRYATGNSLYPTDPVRRATIDRLLDWDLSTLYKAVAAYVVSIYLVLTPLRKNF